MTKYGIVFLLSGTSMLFCAKLEFDLGGVLAHDVAEVRAQQASRLEKSVEQARKSTEEAMQKKIVIKEPLQKRATEASIASKALTPAAQQVYNKMQPILAQVRNKVLHDIDQLLDSLHLNERIAQMRKEIIEAGMQNSEFMQRVTVFESVADTYSSEMHAYAMDLADYHAALVLRKEVEQLASTNASTAQELLTHCHVTISDKALNVQKKKLMQKQRYLNGLYTTMQKEEAAFKKFQTDRIDPSSRSLEGQVHSSFNEGHQREALVPHEAHHIQ